MTAPAIQVVLLLAAAAGPLDPLVPAGPFALFGHSQQLERGELLVLDEGISPSDMDSGNG